MKNKIVSISDNHGILDFKLPPGKILTISGDITPTTENHLIGQEYWIKNHFLPWCDKLIKDNIFEYVVFTPGNHDRIFERMMKSNKETEFRLSLPNNVYYLRDNMVEIEGIKIYGTPWTPTFGNWYFMEPEAILHNKFMGIPEGLDILLSHGPAFGWNDTIMQYQETDHLGSTALREHIIRANPKMTCTGHIHSGDHKPSKIPSKFNDDNDGFDMINIVNVSLLDENYEVAYRPFEFTIEPK